MDAIIPAFERASGYKVSISYATTPEFFKRFDGGMRADMAILFTETMDRFVQSTKIAVGSRKLIWIWTHPLTDWLRLWAWRWLP